VAQRTRIRTHRRLVVPEASVTRTRSFFVPFAFALPVTAPDFERVRPLGNAPVDRVHVYGALPPEAVRLAR
jgi:hypothetical protein